MRVLFDPNVYLSFLLAPSESQSTIVKILRAAARDFALVLPPEAIDEVRRVVRSKPYLSARIPLDEVEQLIDDLAAVAEVVSRLAGTVPRMVRDRNDDYLVAQAIAARVDVVVSGDSDLLALGMHQGVRFVDPASFAAELGL